MSLDYQPRKTFRGVRKCKSCGVLRANRSRNCKNINCKEHESNRNGTLSKNKLDSVKLISYIDSMIFSVQCKEKEPQYKRDFVQITEITLISDESNSIVSQNAVCFQESCNQITGSHCNHIQSANECKKTAVEVSINKKVLFDLNITQDKKLRLWKCYNEQKTSVPPVQKINGNVFAVACSESSIQFPAKRLHVKVKESFTCACKRLKIVMSADESFVFKDEVCDHILLALAAILSSETLKKEYRVILNTVENLWREEVGEKISIQQHEITEILNSLCEMSAPPINPNIEHNEFSKWMNFVIESINLTLDFKTQNMDLVRHKFHVHTDTFESLAKRFKKGDKRMLPNKKYSETYAWRLLTPFIVKKIFATEEMSIALERKFHKEGHGYISLEEFLSREKIKEPINLSKIIPIIPKLSSIWIDIDQNRSCGVKILWTPDIYPKSKFGLLVIEYGMKYSHPYS